MGADHVINPTKEDPVAAIKNLTNGKGAEFVVEGSGHPVALKQAQEAASWGSTVCVLGIHFQPTEIDFIELCKKNGAITAGLSNCIYTKELISLIEKGRLDLTPMVTHRFPLTEAIHAYEVFDKKIDGAIKVLLKP
jgi:alcohol dehydrogenase